jgi:tetratricopeptide (TPR) repeat protein
MRETVFDKIGMTDSSYSQPLPPDWAKRTAAGTDMAGKAVHGRWHVYPEMAAAGLWTTPTDLATFAIEIALSKQGKANHILSQKMTDEMLAPVMDEAGLGFFLDMRNPGQFGHDGADDGFQALLTMNAKSGKGVAIMANSDLGIAAAEFVLQSVAREYAWNYNPGPQTFSTLLLLAKRKGAPAAINYYGELKKSPAKNSDINEGTLNRLGYWLMNSGQTQDAIAVLERNVQEYPQSSNVYDSLAEGYMKAGQKGRAIANYQKSLQLDPKNQNAVDMLKKLQATD